MNRLPYIACLAVCIGVFFLCLKEELAWSFSAASRRLTYWNLGLQACFYAYKALHPCCSAPRTLTQALYVSFVTVAGIFTTFFTHSFLIGGRAFTRFALDNGRIECRDYIFMDHALHNMVFASVLCYALAYSNAEEKRALANATLAEACAIPLLYTVLLGPANIAKEYGVSPYMHLLPGVALVCFGGVPAFRGIVRRILNVQ